MLNVSGSNPDKEQAQSLPQALGCSMQLHIRGRNLLVGDSADQCAVTLKKVYQADVLSSWVENFDKARRENIYDVNE